MAADNLLDGMVIFAEVVKAASFTKAAENTGHSTSYISKVINKLEERLGVRLIHRTTRRLNLTAEGKLYFEQCQQIIEDAEQAENAISGRFGEPKGTLRVSCPVAYGVFNLRPVLARYTEKYPQISLELDLDDRKVDLIAEGFDIVIRAVAQLEDSSLISRKVSSSEALTLASPDYLKKHGTPRNPYDLDRHKVMSYSNHRQPNIWQYNDLDGSPVQVHVDSVVQTNNSSLMLALAVAGQGICRLPRFCVGCEIDSGKLVELFADYPKQQIGIYMVYPSRKHISPKVRSFIDFVATELGN
ncbi:LysR family transcriptional regulator [Vibrio sp. SCSIO 43137]|uniref:LysR family transcriptional regulator n=1 Tax=Vibrio sp. SCSIO 43137 TaxID=3021011 RepID=UPI002308044D|nr:LysR family transcriptional regulator [Vibrio sp. SCSIO 43137]WCE32337.1 LysR family transcriptional regulator [Vibrio sp. SCSIO 43137]